jgi:pyruvate/2-oxoglutarate dehydrogenase complex dihydrolipoamide dehydrogenase (E3) component
LHWHHSLSNQCDAVLQAVGRTSSGKEISAEKTGVAVTGGRDFAWLLYRCAAGTQVMERSY